GILPAGVSIGLVIDEPICGRIINRYRQFSKTTSVMNFIRWLSSTSDGIRLLNSDLIINDKGNIVGRYSKIDLFYVQPDYLVIRE
ncbi:unnamed protein product, partial [Rotaria sordida]